MRPDFIRVLPDEISRYGYAGAVVLAHIRWRCESDGPGRIVVDGKRWWRVSLEELGREVGGSRRSVRTALDRLGEAVLANHFAPQSNPTLAYRHSTASTSARTETSPTAEGLTSSGAETAPATKADVEIDTRAGLKRHEAGTETAAVPPIETLRKRGDSSGERCQRAPLAVVPDSANPTDPQNRTDEPQRFCDKHLPFGTTKDCPDCGRHRRVHERWAADASARLAAARRAASLPRWACPTCRDTNVVLNNAGEPVRGPCICHHDRTWHQMTDEERQRYAPVLNRLKAKNRTEDRTA